MSEAQKPILTDLLTTSRRLAEAASAGDWDVVADLKGRHEDLVRTFFDGLAGGPLSAHVLSELTQVRVYTDLVLELAKKRRTGLLDAGKKVTKGRRATAAYRDNTIANPANTTVAP
ncbi:MAG: flagellar protein FliT [Gammaproteobacteria bacterium]